ncbi:hypothetical protein [Chitinophaga sp. GbtcB8]|uniref:hypothetical protein n=1 Tax=Chitinophaga sp. GbtcB8 TaxID=2824753 RepID=UPI001C30C805|nr:hypothetical protein [Chitinophaga sp. GbtcB8]
MKLLSALPVLAIVALASLQVSVSSCSKENTDTLVVRDTVHITDTLQLKDTAMTTAILTSTVWKTQESRWVRDNSSISYYLRGGSGNTESLDIQTLTFRADGTGTHYNADGFTVQFNWQWLNNEQTSLKYIDHYPSPTGDHTVIWEHIVYKNGAIKFGEYVTQSTTKLVGYSIWIPVAFTQNANLRLD